MEGDALIGEIPPKAAEQPIIVNHTYGVMSKGLTPSLLKYYGKTAPSQLPSTWLAVGNPELLPLEVNPVLTGSMLKLTVIWQGKPAPGCQVTVEGPGIKEKIQGDATVLVSSRPHI